MNVNNWYLWNGVARFQMHCNKFQLLYELTLQYTNVAPLAKACYSSAFIHQSQNQSQSYLTTDDHSVNMSWCLAQSRLCRTFRLYHQSPNGRSIIVSLYTSWSASPYDWMCVCICEVQETYSFQLTADYFKFTKTNCPQFSDFFSKVWNKKINDHSTIRYLDLQPSVEAMSSFFVQSFLLDPPHKFPSLPAPYFQGSDSAVPTDGNSLALR